MIGLYPRATLPSGTIEMNQRAPRRVVVAMSGGVDSSVAAALLKQQGHDVIGVTLQLYDHGQARARVGACCAGQDIHDARRVAEVLSIPHYVLDYEARFRDAVIESFAEAYAVGETPIPCVTCNQQIQVPRPARDCARTGCRCARHRPLHRAPQWSARPGALSRPGLRSRPELFPVRDDTRAIAPAVVSARRHA